jgi:anti-sigma factor RsiW
MECEKIERMLDRYIRKELDEGLEKEIENHLLTCEACSEEWKIQEAFHQLLDFPVEVKAPPDFILEVMAKVQKIHRKPERPNMFYKGWGRSLVAAGILMIVINVAGISNHVNYDQMLYKTSAIQESIVFSMDEVNRNISRVFNNIDIRIWRD